MKPIVFFLIVFVSLSANPADSLLVHLGLTADYFTVAITSLLCAALIFRRDKVIVILASALIILTALPVSMTGHLPDKDYIYGLFIAVLVAPYIIDLFE